MMLNGSNSTYHNMLYMFENYEFNTRYEFNAHICTQRTRVKKRYTSSSHSTSIAFLCEHITADVRFLSFDILTVGKDIQQLMYVKYSLMGK